MCKTAKLLLASGLFWTALLLLGGGHCIHLKAQSSSQAWGQFTIRHFTPKKWVWEGDAEFRSPMTPSGLANTILRVGFGRRFRYGFVTAGIGTVEAWPLPSGAPDFSEIRIYQRLNLSHKLGNLAFTHSLRTEERWLHAISSPRFTFSLRFRYLLQLMYSFPKAHFLAGTPYILTNCEALTRPLDHFHSQVRNYAAAGIDWQQKWRMDMGLMIVRSIPVDGVAALGTNAVRVTLTRML